MLPETMFWITYWGWAASELLILLRDRMPASGTRVAGGGRGVITAAMLVAIAGGVTVSQRFHQFALPVPRPPAMIAGIVIMWTGIAFRQWSVHTLGRFFRTHVTMLDDHRLIDTGPYAYLRNPSYAGAMLTCLGFGIALDNWLSLALMLAVPGLAFVHRIRIEEQALAGHFGSDWAAYRARRWALLPLLW